MPCEKEHTVIGHKILQHGLPEDIAEHTLVKNWSALYCSPLGLQVREKMKWKLLQGTKTWLKTCLRGGGGSTLH